MAVAGPTITSAVRLASNPRVLVIDYTVPVSGVTRVQVWEKPTGSTALAVRILDTSTLTGRVQPTSRYAADVQVTLHMTLTHVSEGTSTPGSSVNVAAFVVPTPTLTSVSRSSATTALLTFSGLAFGHGSRAYVYRSAPGGNPAQVDAFDVTATSGSRNAPAPNGTAGYDFEIRVGQHSVLSNPSTRRTVEAWYQKPPAPISLVVTRNATTGVVSGLWDMPSVTSRNRVLGYRIFRALKGQPLKAWRTQTTMSFTDTTTVLSSDYDYGVEAYNEAGPSSSRPTASTDAVRERPNAASGLTVTHLGGNRYKLDWTTTPTTERPITNQKILARVPGQTATSTMATASGSVTTYTVTVPSNRVFEVAIVPTNGNGDATATSNWAGPIVSTPLGVSSLSASWLDASTVRIGWSLRDPSIGDALEVEFSTQVSPDPENPAHWSPLGSVATWQTTPQTTQPGASQLVPHSYRARAKHTDSGQVSAWVYSARLDGQAAPLAPSMVMPSRVDATGTIPLSMRHNPVDGTAQTAGQIRYRLQGSSTWTTQTLGTAAEYELPAGTYVNGGWLEVQGRTAGATGVYGVWSGSLLVPLRARPTVTITSPPAGVLESQALTMTWESTDQASASLELWDDTGGNLQLLETATVGPDVRSHTWETVLPDGREILSEIIVRDAWQAAEKQQLAVTVEYNLPAPPLLTAEQAEAASVLLQATPRNALELERLSHVTAARSWSPDDLDAHVGTSTLSLPGEGEVETITLSGDIVSDTFSPPPVSMTAGFRAWSETGATVHLWAEAPGVSSTEGVTVEIPPRSPGWVRMHTATAGTDFGDLHVTVSAGDMIHTWDHYVIGQPRPGVPDDTYFDAHSVREGYVYGWLPGGIAYEAVPVDSEPEWPVEAAPTVHIEIWCSDTGLPGSYKRCGETGTGWDYHDEHPRIGVPIWYVARAVAASGAYAESVPVQITVDSRDTYVHFGDDHGSYVTAGRLVDALTIDGGGLDMESIQYEGHEGWTHHVSDIPLAESISVDLQLLPARGASSLAEWAQALRHTDIIYREPGGIVMRGAPSMGPRRPSSKFVQRISLTVAGTML